MKYELIQSLNMVAIMKESGELKLLKLFDFLEIDEIC